MLAAKHLLSSTHGKLINGIQQKICSKQMQHKQETHHIFTQSLLVLHCFKQSIYRIFTQSLAHVYTKWLEHLETICYMFTLSAYYTPAQSFTCSHKSVSKFHIKVSFTCLLLCSVPTHRYMPCPSGSWHLSKLVRLEAVNFKHWVVRYVCYWLTQVCICNL